MDFKILIFLACEFVFQFSNVSGSSDNISSDSSAHQQGDDDVPGEPLSPLDFKNAEKLSSYYLTQSSISSSTDDPMEKAGLYEGDIIFDKNEKDGQNDHLGKNAIRDTNAKWRNATVPYLISSKFNERERSVVARAVLEIQQQTCITFTPRSTENDYIMITTGDGCSSRVGRIGGLQYVTLGNGCFYPGIVMHELTHTLGFWHQQSSYDRDDYVYIHFENIQPGMEVNFRKTSSKETQNLNASYDTSSIMHYGPFAFSKNREKLKTITPKIPNDQMGQRLNFSEIDVYKINTLYDCTKKLDSNDTGTESNSESSTSQPPNTDSSPENSQPCTDNHHNCQKWARNGECQKNPNWMLVNCKQSCNQCRTTCANNNRHCDTWAANGECSKNPGYMNAHCAKACKQCH